MTPIDVDRRLCVCEYLLQSQKGKRFLHRTVTGHEKWDYYNNLQREKSWGYPAPASTSTVKLKNNGFKIILSI